jgi:hypothetical protein
MHFSVCNPDIEQASPALQVVEKFVTPAKPDIQNTRGVRKRISGYQPSPG